MRAISFLALGASALALGACVPTVNYSGFTSGTAGTAPLRSLATLDCPATEGALTRLSQAPDGRSCDYEGWGGETVRLRLVALDGRSPADVMAPTKAELHALVPVAVHGVRAVDKDEPGEHADVDLPFFHVHSVGDRADVKIFGVKIHSDGDNAEVHARHGGTRTVVHASRDGAEVIAEDVGRTNASLVYVLASDHTRSGYRAVGYVAKGPAAGPLVVGEFRATRRSHADTRPEHTDLDRLIDRNLKG